MCGHSHHSGKPPQSATQPTRRAQLARNQYQLSKIFVNKQLPGQHAFWAEMVRTVLPTDDQSDHDAYVHGRNRVGIYSAKRVLSSGISLEVEISAAHHQGLRWMPVGKICTSRNPAQCHRLLRGRSKKVDPTSACGRLRALLHYNGEFLLRFESTLYSSKKTTLTAFVAV